MSRVVDLRGYQSTYLKPVFTDRIRKDDVKVILEIGSRDAVDALALQQHYSPGKVVIFECNPEALSTCRHNAGLVEGIDLVETAAWDSDGEIAFFSVQKSFVGEKEGKNIGASSCFQDAGTFMERLVQEEIKVPSTRVDTACAALGIGRIDLVCMDVQGAHLQVLRGFGDLLGGVRYIISEIEVTPLYVGQATLPETCTFLYERGFKMVAAEMHCREFGDFLFVRD